MRHATGLGRFQPARIGQRAVFEDPFARFKSQVQPVVIWVAVFQLIDHAQALQVVLKAAEIGHAFVQRVLACVAERRVPEVVRQRNGFHQVFMQAQRPGDGARQLRHLQRMRHPRAKQVAFVVDEHLRLVDQPPERGGMNDAVTVSLEFVARGRGRRGVKAPARRGRVAGVGRELALRAGWRGERCAIWRAVCGQR